MTEKKEIGKDERGESVFVPFVLIIGLVLVLGFMINGLMQYAISGNLSRGADLSVNSPFGLYDYTFIDANPADDRYVDFGDGTGYEVTDDDIIDYVPYPTHEDPFIFEDPDGDKKYVHIIRNNRDYDPDSTNIWEMYLDFVSIRREKQCFFKVEDGWQDYAIPFQTIEDNFNLLNGTNASQSDFVLGESQDTLFLNVTEGGEDAFIEGLWDNEFYLLYGWSLFRIQEVDFWNAISMILYTDIPGVHPLVNFLLHAFVIGTIIFVAFTMGTRLTPFLGGG